MRALLNLKNKRLFNRRLFFNFLLFLVISVPIRLFVILFNFDKIEKYFIVSKFGIINHLFSAVSVAELSFLIERTSYYSPWRVKCLEQAILAAVYLNAKTTQYSFYLGVINTNSTQLAAHAWLISNENVITGGSFPGDFTIIYHFQK